MTVQLEPSLGVLPHFNPDLEGAEPGEVLQFRERLRQADAIIISSPEYAHGIAGVLKDALDWIVARGELSGKPVALFNASPRASLAQTALAEVIRTMDARMVEPASIAVPLLGRNMTADAIVQDADIAAQIREALRQLSATVPLKEQTE